MWLDAINIVPVVASIIVFSGFLCVHDMTHAISEPTADKR